MNLFLYYTFISLPVFIIIGFYLEKKYPRSEHLSDTKFGFWLFSGGPVIWFLVLSVMFIALCKELWQCRGSRVLFLVKETYEWWTEKQDDKLTKLAAQVETKKVRISALKAELRSMKGEDFALTTEINSLKMKPSNNKHRKIRI